MKPVAKILAPVTFGLLALAPIIPGSAVPARADDCPDVWITAQAKARLIGDRGLGAFKIDVETDQCVITLNGCVSNSEQKQEAAKIAAKVKKVRSVRNNLTLCPKVSPESEANDSDEVDDCADALITSEVKTLLLAEEGLKAFKINVETDSCVVTLLGCVDTEARKKTATEAAARAKGVRDVKSKLTICKTG